MIPKSRIYGRGRLGKEKAKQRLITEGIAVGIVNHHHCWFVITPKMSMKCNKNCGPKAENYEAFMTSIPLLKISLLGDPYVFCLPLAVD